MRKSYQREKIIGAVILGVFSFAAIAFAAWFANWLTVKNYPSTKIEDTGEETYACTSEWQEDKVIQNCKWYPIYREVKETP